MTEYSVQKFPTKILFTDTIDLLFITDQQRSKQECFFLVSIQLSISTQTYHFHRTTAR